MTRHLLLGRLNSKPGSSFLQNPEGQLQIIQRGLILLTQHLEGFRKRYAYHLRRWQLAGKGINSHQRPIEDKPSTPIRVVLQPAGSAEKVKLQTISLRFELLLDILTLPKF